MLEGEQSFGERVVRYREDDRRPLAIASLAAIAGLSIAADVVLHPPAGRIVDEFLHPPPFAGIPNEWESLGLATLLASAATAFVAIVACARLAFSPMQRSRSGRLAIGAGHVRVDGVLKVTTISGTALAGEREVHIFDGGQRPRLIVVTSSETEAAEIAAAARPIAASGSGRFRLSLIDPGPVGLALAGLLLTTGLGMATRHPAWFLALPIFFAPALWPVTVVVGPDGIVFTGLRTRELISFSTLAEVRTEGAALVLIRKDGKRSSLVFGGDKARLDALVGRIECARANVLDAPAFENFLEKGPSATHEWIARLRSLSVPGYRHAALSEERLWDVLTNGNCAHTARMAAAVLLRPNMNDSKRERLRALSQGTVSPQLRHAFVEILALSDPLAEEGLADILNVDNERPS